MATPNPEHKPNVYEVWAEIVEKCWEDEAYKKKVLANPAAALREAGYPMPDVKCQAIEEKTSDLKFYFSVPKKPDSKNVQDDTLKKIAAGQPCTRGR